MDHEGHLGALIPTGRFWSGSELISIHSFFARSYGNR